jgi:membrane associated rhomboid family serine protease
MNTLWNDIKFKMLHSGSKVMMLVWINIIVYLAIYVPSVIEQIFTGFGHSIILTETNEYLALPSYLPKLLHRAWTPLTYMFIHAGVFHILFNMLWLYWMGQIFEEYLGNKRAIGVYILGGLTGAFFFVASYNLLPMFTQHPEIVAASSNVGASAAIMAIIIATATLLPDYTIYMMFIGPVKLKWLALFFVIIDFLGITGLNAGGEISHLGGALFGFIYIKQLQRGNDMAAFIGDIFKKRSKLKVAAKGNLKNPGNQPRQEDVDRILDKISQTGYESLSKQEKEILFRASKDNEG